jgi:hypothetical protein
LGTNLLAELRESLMKVPGAARCRRPLRPPVTCAPDGPILLSREGALLMGVRFDEPPPHSSSSRVTTTGSHTRRRAGIGALRDGCQRDAGEQ